MTFSTRLLRLLGALAVTAAAALPAHADFIALNPTNTVGNQPWAGALGMDFDVFSPIWITQLGAFDSGKNGFTNTIRVGIFNRDTQTLVGTSAQLTTANTVASGTSNRFMDIVDFQLAAGHYTIVADGFSAQDQNGNVGIGGTASTINDGGGLIKFLSSRFGNANTALVFPTNPDGSPVNRYDAGTFQYKAVPEPASIALLGLGLLGLAGVRRRRR